MYSNPQISGKIALVGGDEFTAECESMDRALLDMLSLSKPRITVIPTAASHENPGKAALNGISYFSNLGADVTQLMVLNDSEANDEKFLQPIENTDVIYFTGGDPKYLLKILSGSLFLKKVLEAISNGIYIIGSSAGAMVLGTYMWHNKWSKCLGIVKNVAVLPHHENAHPALIYEKFSKYVNQDLILLGIDSKTCAVKGTDKWEILGNGGIIIYTKDGWEKFESGQSLPMDTTTY